MTDGKTQEPTKNELALHHSSISLFARNLIYQRNMSAECGGTVDVVRQGCGVMLGELTQLKLS